MEGKRSRIFWHQNEVEVQGSRFDAFDGAEIKGKKGLEGGLCAPGPKAEPPFEVEVLFSRFLFRNRREASVYLIKISSLNSSWAVVKTIDEFVGFVSSLKTYTDALSQLSVRNLLSLSPRRQEEREILIRLVISTFLNSPALNMRAQGFVLTNTVSIEEMEAIGTEEVLEEYVGKGDGVYLVEHRGWIRGWECGYFQLRSHILTRTSPISGRVKETINTKEALITIRGKTMVVKLPKTERVFFSNDKTTVSTLRSWFATN